MNDKISQRQYLKEIEELIAQEFAIEFAKALTDMILMGHGFLKISTEGKIKHAPINEVLCFPADEVEGKV